MGRTGTIIVAAMLSAGVGAAPAAGQSANVFEAEGSVTSTPGTAVSNPTQEGFEEWLAAFRPRAMAEGIAAGTLDAAVTGLRYDADVVEKDRKQTEFTKTIWDYLDTAVSDDRVTLGQAAVAREAALLDRIEKAYGVEKEIVAAVWGLESAYGTYRGKTNVIQALATLAYDGRRGAFFEAQLIAALRIVESGDVRPEEMTGSWAGAMGHTQFMPTSYLKHAVDFTGDGRRDIWGDDPADSLASTAAYLRGFGWTEGQPWGVEVTLPKGFDYELSGERVKKPPSAWAAMGIRDTGGNIVPDHGLASILLPAGHRGAAFMIFDNFHVIEKYNTADAYVIAVGHLADRIGGGAPIGAAWPREDRALLLAEREELQRRLTEAGFDTKGVDGKIGPLTIAAVRAYQKSLGLVPDGYAGPDVLKRLRGAS